MSTGEEPGNNGGSDRTLPVHEAKTVFHGPDADFGPAPAAAGAGPAPAGVTSLDEFSRSLIAIGLIEPGELEDFAADSALGVLGLSRPWSRPESSRRTRRLLFIRKKVEAS